MALSRLAREFAAEIAGHDWSDAHYRLDRAGHQRERDTNAVNGTPLTPREAHSVKVNVMWVTAQVLWGADPNFDVQEFARMCGVKGLSPSWLKNGLRSDRDDNPIPATPRDEDGNPVEELPAK
ncbi:hypothetical protein AB0D67_36740 [Streptosporangium sp. NPDC048047]|uniref:hypothetical protein n=1 Tax=Streptosporangium sp. NPDC048047 TaxID=3155748 RepID=UPI00342525A2